MKTYSTYHPEKGLISYIDTKRYLWLSSMLFPLSPLFFIYLFLQNIILDTFYKNASFAQTFSQIIWTWFFYQSFHRCMLYPHTLSQILH